MDIMPSSYLDMSSGCSFKKPSPIIDGIQRHTYHNQVIKEIKALVTYGWMHSSKCKSMIWPFKKKKKSTFLMGFLWGLRNGKTTEAEFRTFKKPTSFSNQERWKSPLSSLCLRGKWLFHQLTMHCSVVFIYDWSLYVPWVNYWKTSHSDRNSHGWEHSGRAAR